MGCLDREIIHGDRRRENRYDLELALRYQYDRDGEVETGSGRTLDFSRFAVRIEAESVLPDRGSIKLHVNWPFLLQEVCPLELRILGEVQRTDSRGTLVRILKHEFCTAGERSFAQGEGSVRLLSLTA